MKDCYCEIHFISRVRDITGIALATQPETDKPIYAKARVALLQYDTHCGRSLDTDAVKCDGRAVYLVTILREGY